MCSLPDLSFLLQHSWLLSGFKTPMLNSSFFFRQVCSFYEPDFSHTLGLSISLASFILLFCYFACLFLFLWNPYLASLALLFLYDILSLLDPFSSLFTVIVRTFPFRKLIKLVLPILLLFCSCLVLCSIFLISFFLSRLPLCPPTSLAHFLFSSCSCLPYHSSFSLHFDHVPLQTSLE